MIKKQSDYIKNKIAGERADKEAEEITNRELFREPIASCSTSPVALEVYQSQRIWMARYMAERKRIYSDLTYSEPVEDVKRKYGETSGKYADRAFASRASAFGRDD